MGGGVEKDRREAREWVYCELVGGWVVFFLPTLMGN